MRDMRMPYKGYFGSIQYDKNDQIFYGKIECIHTLVSYGGRNIRSLRYFFRKAVDDYLTFCQQTNRQPEKPADIIKDKYAFWALERLNQKNARYYTTKKVKELLEL